MTGSLLALAAGQMRDVSDKPAQHVTYIYARGHWWAASSCLKQPYQLLHLA